MLFKTCQGELMPAEALTSFTVRDAFHIVNDVIK